MHNLLALLSVSILTLTACQTQPIQHTQSKQIKQATKATVEKTANQDFNYSGQYATAHETKQHYYQTLSIKPITASPQNNKRYQVNFSATKVLGRSGCSFSGTAVEKEGVLWLDISNEANKPNKASKEVAMYIRPMKDKLGVEVFTEKFDERFAMMYYCRGGASLAGDYLKNNITANSIGTINANQSIAEVLQQIPKAQVKKTVGHGEFAEDLYDDYQVYNHKQQLLFTLTPKQIGSTKQKINRVLINSPTFSTNKGIHNQSIYGEIKKAYSIDKIEPTRTHIVLTIDDINANFSIAKTELQQGWWNESEKRVNIDKIPDTAKIDSFILWWNK